MKLYITSVYSLIIGLFVITAGVQAQNGYELLPESNMQITGTSTIHDWECDVEELNLYTNFGSDLTAKTIPASADFIKSLSLTVPVEKIESGKGGMNKKIYGALKEKEHPTISYQFSNGEIVSRDTTAGTFTVKATGKLTIAGATKTVTFPVDGSIAEDGTLNFSGSYTLNMKDYKVDPPSAMFGTIKSGEVVTIVFDLKLRPGESAKL